MMAPATKESIKHRQKDIEGMNGLLPSDKMQEMLAQCDFVVLALPLTNESRESTGVIE